MLRSWNKFRIATFFVKPERTKILQNPKGGVYIGILLKFDQNQAKITKFAKRYQTYAIRGLGKTQNR